MIRVAIIGERWFSNKHLIWQVTRLLPDNVTILLPLASWAGTQSIEGAAASRGLPIRRGEISLDQIEGLLLFADGDENGGRLWNFVRQARERGLHIERFFSSSEPRIPRLQMMLF